MYLQSRHFDLVFLFIMKKGEKLPTWWKENISKGIKKGKDNPCWKGEKATYWTKHKFLVKEHGNPSHCSMCGKPGYVNKAGKWTIQWANKIKIYTRNVKNYEGLCPKCHCIQDGRKIPFDSYICGTSSKYREGCRCSLCKKAKSLYRKGLIGFKHIVKTVIDTEKQH